MTQIRKEHITMELWKDIKDYENLYKVSSFGKVKSLNYKGTGKEKILKPLNINTYGRVVLVKYKVKTNFKVNRLVAQAFLDLDIKNKNILVCHKSEQLNKNGLLNDSLDNLFLGSPKDNTKDMINKNRSISVGVKGKNHTKSIKVNQYNLNGEFIKSWDSLHDIQRDLGIHLSNIWKCCNGLRKKAGGFTWEYF